MEKQKLLKLQSQLKEFGLDPYDWNLEQNQKRSWRIRHTQMPSFCFIGVTKESQSTWQKLSLLSL